MTKYDQLGTEEDDLNGRNREFRTKYCLAIIDVIIYFQFIRYTFLDIIYFIILDQSVPPYLDIAYCIMLDGRVGIEISDTRL